MIEFLIWCKCHNNLIILHLYIISIFSHLKYFWNIFFLNYTIFFQNILNNSMFNKNIYIYYLININSFNLLDFSNIIWLKSIIIKWFMFNFCLNSKLKGLSTENYLYDLVIVFNQLFSIYFVKKCIKFRKNTKHMAL